jgi:luciferase family oxidoreductase group 1
VAEGSWCTASKERRIERHPRFTVNQPGAVWTEGTTVSLRLSILDQSPVNDTETATDAFQHTIELATKAEEWGYHRFWVSEHHGSDRVMGSSPEVLVAHLLAKTTRIRVGSGGVMLQHYSPYKVAENFNVLASLAPGRVDLGIGRGPGGLPRSTRALQQEMGDQTMPFAEKLRELEQFLHNRLEEHHPLYGLRVSPVPPQPAEVFLLGTNTSSAELAASLGIPYVFAQFLNSDVTTMGEAMATYHKYFDATQHKPPQAMLALSVIAADTDAEARRYASDIKVVRIRLESGRTFTVGTLAGAEEFGRQSQENYTIAVHEANVVHGSRDTVLQQLSDIQRRYEVEELIVVTAIKDFPKRLHSYELLSPACRTDRAAGGAPGTVGVDGARCGMA